MTRRVTTAETAQLLDGRYRIERELGVGGMARVVLAHDVSLGRPVALKVPAAHLAEDAGFLERFRREAVATASLGHPNIVAVYDRGEAGGLPYIAMEYVSGRTLRQVIDDDAPLAEPLAADLAVQALRALDFAHTRGVVHRDVKPHNMVVREDGQLKVMDFGIARSSGGETALTLAGSVLGTAQYLSPEQARGRPVGPGSDIYSMGVVLFEMLTGTLPFDGATPMAIAVRHADESPPTARGRNPDVGAPMSAVVARALEKDPARRFASAGDMAAAVAAAAAAPAGDMAAAGATAALTRVLPAAAATTVLHRSRRRWTPLLILAALLAGAVLVYATWGGGPSAPAKATGTTNSPPTTSAPAVSRVPAGIVGAPIQAALDSLAAAGFTNVVYHAAYNRAPNGHVVSMSQPAGTRISPTTRIYLTVSRGPAPRPAPPGHHRHHHGDKGKGGGD
jgi:eukaryotic-like serine/threonine-protein kinase